MLSIDNDRTACVCVGVNVGAKNHNFYTSLILDQYNIMIVMQKLKFYSRIYFCYQCGVSALQFASKTTNA